MTRKTTPPAAEDRTPLTRLREGGAHAIVGYQLAQAAIVTNQVFDERVGHPRGGMRRVEFTILALVQVNRDVTARQLARALAVTPPNIAIWLDKLESRGLVARERSVSDARMQHVRLTPRGTGRALGAGAARRRAGGARRLECGGARDAGGVAAQGRAVAPQARARELTGPRRS